MAAAPMQPVNTAGNLDSLLKVIQGGTDLFKGSSTTQTTSSNISAQGMDRLLQQILSGSQGLGAVSSGQKSAGLYNSTTNQMLVNDLITRASGELAARQAGTTTTTKKNPQLGGSDILTLLASTAASKVLGPTAKKAGEKLGLNGLGDKLADTIFGSSGGFNVATADIGTSGAATDLMGNILGAGSASLDSLASGGNILASFLGDSIGSAGLEALGASWAPEALGLTGIGEIGGSTAAIAELGSTVFPGAVEAIGAATEGASIVETLATVAAAVGWIVCTELYRQGRMPRRFYVHGAKVFNNYPRNRVKGYYVWAIPTVQFLRKNPSSRRAKIISKIFNARAEYLAACAGEKTARKTVAGFLTTHLLYGFCWTLSFFVPEQDWSVVYG